MSTDTFRSRPSSHFATPRPSPSASSSQHQAPDRRRQWLISRGLISQTNPTTRRLGFLPRINSAPTRPPPPIPTPPDIRVRIDPQAAVPVLVARPSCDISQQQHNNHNNHNNSHHPRSSTTSSVQTPRSHHQPRASRTTSTPPRVPRHHRRLRFRLSVRRRAPPPTSPPPSPPASPPTPRPAPVHHDSPSHRLSKDSLCGSDFDEDVSPALRPTTTPRSASMSSDAPSSRTPITVYTVLDRTLPSYVLQGNAVFEPTKWNDYRAKIDQLADDDRFMHYLTAPVLRHPNKSRPGTNRLPTPRNKMGKLAPHPPQLAVNKLYPLAFIRLMEAHAKHSAETEPPACPQPNYGRHMPHPTHQHPNPSHRPSESHRVNLDHTSAPSPDMSFEIVREASNPRAIRKGRQSTHFSQDLTRLVSARCARTKIRLTRRSDKQMPSAPLRTPTSVRV